MLDTLRTITNYISDVQDLLGRVEPGEIAAAADLLYTAWQHGRRVLFMGNGGSSSSVSHIVNDLQKNIFLEAGKPLKALCLSDSTPLLMAWANDTEWSNVFAPQVACWAEPGDVVIGVSGSGNSMNVIQGMEAAKRSGATTLGLAGFDGGVLRSSVDRCIVVRSNNMQHIE
ncbi:MAG TPA: SIS domain-containing protein, partial [Chthonomonadales bacterium]|nr:SIS domain-containing protein [Chthonomonadales bacterium]